MPPLPRRFSIAKWAKVVPAASASPGAGVGAGVRPASVIVLSNSSDIVGVWQPECGRARAARVTILQQNPTRGANQMRAFSRSALALAVLFAATGTAGAEEEEYTKHDWPLEVTKRPIVLARSMFEARGDTMFINLSDGAAGEPVSLAPDLYYGVTNHLTVGINHERGFCLTSDGCASKY